MTMINNNDTRIEKYLASYRFRIIGIRRPPLFTSGVIGNRRRVWHHFSDAVAIYSDHKPSMIGPSISAITLSLLSTLGPHVEQWYLRQCRALELKKPFLSEGITINTK